MKDVNWKADFVKVVVFMSIESCHKIAIVVVEDIVRKTTRISLGIEETFEPYLWLLYVDKQSEVDRDKDTHNHPLGALG